MKPYALLAVLLLALPTTAGSSFIGHSSAGPDTRTADAAAPCTSTPGEFSCVFFYNTTSDPANAASSVVPAVTYEIPSFAKTLATITVVLRGQDNGWTMEVLRHYEYRSPQWNSSFNTSLSTTAHTPEGENYVTRETTTHVFDSSVGSNYQIQTPAGGYVQNFTTFLVFRPASQRLGVPGSAGPATLSAGAFEIFYLAEAVPHGAAPSRPAATRADPQLLGHARDADRADMDLTAGWLDDAVLGDGLMDVHLAVVGDLTRLDWNGTNTPFPPPAPVGSSSFSTQEKDWALHFRVQGVDYYVKWYAYSTGGGQASSSRSWIQCGLYRSTTPSGPSITKDPLISIPACSTTNDTLNAEFPENSIGNPGSGVLFEALSANADEIFSGYPQPIDRLGPPMFPFALGGPDVWDGLNGGRFRPPRVQWWQDPLSSDNLPNTVQVGGAAVAVVAFFVGLILLRQRRQKVRALLREIERAETEHERDTRAALLALGALDSKFADMYHKGALNDDQYQVVAQRLATAATRFALRQGLGLDDGTAGDRAFVNVPVRGDPAREEVRP